MYSNFSILIRRSTRLVTVIASLMLVISSCVKTTEETPPITFPGLLSFNLAPDQSLVMIKFSNTTITKTALRFSQFTGQYQNVTTGDKSVQAFDSTSGTVLATGNLNFEAGQFYSSFFVGYGGNYRNVITNDNAGSADGKAHIRYINAVADSTNEQTITITAGGSGVVNENRAFRSVSGFKTVAPGELTVKVKGPGVDATKTFTVAANKVYTIILQGVPGSLDELKKPQVVYLENGSL